MTLISSNSPILFHTDISRIQRSTLNKIDRKQNITSAIYQMLLNTFPDQELWFPAFNYDFIKTRIFDPENDPIQVGAFNESLRNSDNFMRSEIPVFSILRQTSENKIYCKPEINPFDLEGEFSEIRRRDGNVCFFGASIESLTFIHFVENLVSIPYRYLKVFSGRVKSGNDFRETSLSFLVRPAGLSVDYDWQKIHALLDESRLSFKIDSFGSYEFYNVNTLTDFMLDKYSEDVFWTLNQDSRINVERKLDELGRSFEIEDFELDSLNA